MPGFLKRLGNFLVNNYAVDYANTLKNFKGDWLFNHINKLLKYAPAVSVPIAAVSENEPQSYKQGGVLKAQKGNAIPMNPLNWARWQAYKIVTDPNVWRKAGANRKDIIKNVLRTKPVMDDQNKAEFLFGVKRPETTDGQAYDWSNDIKENGYKNVKSYNGTLNPYNEYILNDRDKELVKELAKAGYSTSLNINDEYTDPDSGIISKETPYFDDVHGYRIKFHNDENGNPAISASDLYDFGKNYTEGFSDLNVERGGSGNIEWQRRALNLVGQPYKLVQHNIPIRFTNNPQGKMEIQRVNSFTNQVLDKLSDSDIAKITNSGLIKPAIVNNRNGGLLGLWDKAYNSNFGNALRTVLFGQDHNLSQEEYAEKHGFSKPLTGFAPLPTIPESGPFEGIEYLAKGHFGTGARYNAGLQNLATEREAAKVLKQTSQPISKWDKFLRKSVQEQDGIIKYWNKERFKSMRQLEQYPKELEKFKAWINKHKTGGILKAQDGIAFTPYLLQQQAPQEVTFEEDEPGFYVPQFNTPTKVEEPKKVEETPKAEEPEAKETPKSSTYDKDVGYFKNFGDSINHYEGGFYTKAYRDAHGWSIGKGHFLGTDPKWSNYSITMDQAKQMLAQDYKKITDALDKQIAKHPEKSKIIDKVKYNVLFDLGFNIGTGYYEKIFNAWDGTVEGMAQILNKYGRRSLATDPKRKAQEEKGLAKRVDARVRAWLAK